ncbi:hypothetical protein ACBQ54_03900 [Providencia vermicola]|uniref:hypothetical protein n=2 Tax=Providencia TaxID=586 RepID=UPI00234B8A8B|nr:MULTISPECIES: hypothetical protein [unclassified Providencia]HEC8327637.1 hypothetical protein [Providencia rettgeri]
MLSHYISQALVAKNCTLIVNQQQQDSLSEVFIKTRQWQFADGVVLLCTEEIEIAEFTCDSQCPERWIIWQLVEENGLKIFPKRKEFFNICQQNFWLKMKTQCRF